MRVEEKIKYNILKLLRIFYKLIPYRKYEISTKELYERIEREDPNEFVRPEIKNKPMSGKDVSIIIPVYNTGKYLKECLDSVLNQDIKCSVEIIIVDDGSTDNSYEIIKGYRKYDNVIIIKQDNRGFSGARNRGLDEATGKYIMFMDSDDILNDNAIQKLFDYAENYNADIIMGSYSTFPEPDKTFKMTDTVFKTNNMSEKMKAIGYLPGKLFKRKLFKKIRLPLNLLFEDTIVHLLILPLSNDVVFIPDIIFKYRMHNDSISHRHPETGKSLDTYWVVKELLKQRKELEIPQSDELYKFLLYQLSFITYTRIWFYPHELKKSVFLLGGSILSEYERDGIKLNKSQQYVQLAFKKQKYKLWEICSRINAYDNALVDY